MPQVPIRPGLTLSCRVTGAGHDTPLLLITGLGGVQEGWFRQVPYFERHYQVVTFDNRGAGRSSVLDVSTRMVDLAEDAVLLLDALELDRAHVFGVSMGGKIAQELALGWPERVDRLVLGCTTPGGPHVVRDQELPAVARLAHMDEEEIFREVVPRLFGRPHRERHPQAMRGFARSRARHPQDPRGLDRQREAFEQFDAWDRLPALRHRTLVITGDLDEMTDPRNSDLLVERLPDAVKHVVPGAGHSFHVEAPEEVNRVVHHFLQTGALPG